MKILILCSGGDAPGMNRFIFDVYSKFKNETYYAKAGFKGLVEGDIHPLSEVVNKRARDLAGTVIKSSRLPEFKEDAVFNRGLENAKKFDCVIILGGNGSEKGAKQLYENGVNTLFVPATIDNDVNNSCYSLGFFTAISECVYAIENSMQSMDSFGYSCIFEVMGRDCSAIAKEVAKETGADYLVAEKNDLDFEKIKSVIEANLGKEKSTCIVMRENIVEAKKVERKLNTMLGKPIVRTHIVGRTQRGGKPTKKELEMASKFAKEIVFCIKKGVFGMRVLADSDLNTFVDVFE